MIPLSVPEIEGGSPERDGGGEEGQVWGNSRRLDVNGDDDDGERETTNCACSPQIWFLTMGYNGVDGDGEPHQM